METVFDVVKILAFGIVAAIAALALGFVGMLDGWAWKLGKWLWTRFRRNKKPLVQTDVDPTQTESRGPRSRHTARSGSL